MSNLDQTLINIATAKHDVERLVSRYPNYEGLLGVLARIERGCVEAKDHIQVLKDGNISLGKELNSVRDRFDNEIRRAGESGIEATHIIEGLEEDIRELRSAKIVKPYSNQQLRDSCSTAGVSLPPALSDVPMPKVKP